ncbi:MAG: RpiB/LacA/LacB family sugar-phosphate isomerase [Miltoncostaeaceae bacterium]
MRVAVAADEALPVVDAVVRALAEGGAEVDLFGPPAGGTEEWVDASAAAAREVAAGRAALGVVLCWSGTGAAMAANKVPGARAALCTDAPTARMAREYNRANVLALSMRLTSEAVAAEIVAAFLGEPEGTGEFNDRNLAALDAVDGAPDLPWPAPTPGRPELCWEDMPVGWTFTTPEVAVPLDAVVGFARRYDPQPFHLDPAAAAGSVFGALVASGWHMTAIMMRLFADHGPRIRGGVVGLGVEELRWAALHPGRSVRIEGEVVEARRSRSGSPRGVVRMRVRLMAGDDEVQHMISALLVPARA